MGKRTSNNNKLMNKLHEFGHVVKCVNEDDSLDFMKEIQHLREILVLMNTQQPKSFEEMRHIVETYRSFGRGYTLDKLVYLYGNSIGNERWESYCDKQAMSNTLEYKTTRFGWSSQQFNEYNKSRAVTKDNLCKRHGGLVGTEKWEAYCERQRFTNTKEHLKGDYEVVNGKKSHGMDGYIARHGNNETAKNAYNGFWEKQRPRYSKISQLLFQEIFKELNPIEKSKTYFAELNQEYGVYDSEVRVYYKFDFVCVPLNLSIEFQGDHYHGNPSIYRPTDQLRGRGQTKKTASDVWRKDQRKKDVLWRERSIRLLEVWESDYNSNSTSVIQRILGIINEIRTFK